MIKTASNVNVTLPTEPNRRKSSHSVSKPNDQSYKNCSYNMTQNKAVDSKGKQIRKGRLYACYLCCFETPHKQRSFAHMERKHLQFECTVCKKWFMGKTEYNRHNKKYHPNVRTDDIK